MQTAEHIDELKHAACVIIKLLEQYTDPEMRAAIAEIRRAVRAEELTYELKRGPVVKATPGKKRGPTRRLDYQAIRDAVVANELLPPEKRRTRDEIAAEFGTSAVTVRKAMRIENAEPSTTRKDN